MRIKSLNGLLPFNHRPIVLCLFDINDFELDGLSLAIVVLVIGVALNMLTA